MRAFFALLVIAGALMTVRAHAQQHATPDAPAPAASAAGPVLPPLPDIDTAAFDGFREKLLPLSPAQIRELHRNADAADRAAAEPPRFVPRPVSSSLLATLTPGSTPPVVRVFPNYVSAVLFIDESGSPLMIEAVDKPGGDTFNVTWSSKSDNPSNGLTISPTQMYATGNIIVHLVDVRVPVPVMIVSGQREVDTQAGIRVAGVGGGLPAEALPGAADAGLQAFLDGMPPPAAKALTTPIADVQVWQMDGHFIVRAGAERTLTSPAWTQRKSSPDGTTVYVVGPVSPLVLLTDGQTLSVPVSGY